MMNTEKEARKKIKQEMSELCSFWQPFCFSKFVRIVNTNFHEKSGLCSSKNERVMVNLVFCPAAFSACDQATYRSSRQLKIMIIIISQNITWFILSNIICVQFCILLESMNLHLTISATREKCI